MYCNVIIHMITLYFVQTRQIFHISPSPPLFLLHIYVPLVVLLLFIISHIECINILRAPKLFLPLFYMRLSIFHIVHEYIVVIKFHVCALEYQGLKHISAGSRILIMLAPLRPVYRDI